MKYSKSLENLVELIKNNKNLSNCLIRCHNLIAQSVPVDEFDSETQADLYDLYRTSIALKQLENEVFPPENKKINELEKLLIEKENRIIELEQKINV